MILVTAATELEMQAFTDTVGAGKEQEHIRRLVTGIGPVEAALSVAGTLHKQPEIDRVLNFGIAGAYPENNTRIQADLLDICLAEQEVFGDLGVQLEGRVERFDAGLPVQDRFILDQGFLAAAGEVLKDIGVPYKQGVFVTVNCASGTQCRGEQLGRQFRGLCENMEGAAVARVCKEFSLPCLEVRSVSNMVEDRKKANWRLQEACVRAGKAAAAIATDRACNRVACREQASNAYLQRSDK